MKSTNEGLKQMNITKAFKYGIAFLCIMMMAFVMAGQVIGQTGGGTAGKHDPSPVPGSAAKQSEVSDHVIKVYYFHTTVRCYSCNKIERLTREAVNEGFGDELARGLVRVEVLNVDEPNNKHFVIDYQLFTKSVIISDMSGNKAQRWKNLQKVWELLRDENAFKAYVQKELKKYLSEKTA